MAGWDHLVETHAGSVFRIAYWYPTVVRIPNGSTDLESGEKSDYYYRYYLEFDAEMPDALFDPTNAEAP